MSQDMTIQDNICSEFRNGAVQLFHGLVVLKEVTEVGEGKPFQDLINIHKNIKFKVLVN